jgi:hypothetical protein
MARVNRSRLTAVLGLTPQFHVDVAGVVFRSGERPCAAR